MNCTKLTLKNIVLTLMVIVLTFMGGNATEAATWVWATSTDSITYEIDSSSVQYVTFPNVGRTVVCWEKDTSSDKSYRIHRVVYRFFNGAKEWASLSTTAYYSDGRYRYTMEMPHELSNNDFHIVLPDSVGEACFDKTMEFVPH